MITWILRIAAGWLLLALAVALPICKVIQNRDRQVATDTTPEPRPR